MHYTHYDRTGLLPANGGFNHYNQLFDREVIEASRRIDEELTEIDEEDGISIKVPGAKLAGIVQAAQDFNDYHNMTPAEREVSDEYHYQRETGKDHDQALKVIEEKAQQEALKNEMKTHLKLQGANDETADDLTHDKDVTQAFEATKRLKEKQDQEKSKRGRPRSRSIDLGQSVQEYYEDLTGRLNRLKNQTQIFDVDAYLLDKSLEALEKKAKTSADPIKKSFYQEVRTAVKETAKEVWADRAVYGQELYGVVKDTGMAFVPGGSLANRYWKNEKVTALDWGVEIGTEIGMIAFLPAKVGKAGYVGVKSGLAFMGSAGKRFAQTVERSWGKVTQRLETNGLQPALVGVSDAQRTTLRIQERAAFKDDMTKFFNQAHKPSSLKTTTATGRTSSNKVGSDTGKIKFNSNVSDAAASNEVPNISGGSGNKGLYNSHEVRHKLEQQYPGGVTSSTVPKPNQKNVQLAGQRHPETGIVFDQKGFPIFDDVAKFDTRIPKEIAMKDNSQSHMRTATNMLNEAIKKRAINDSQFNTPQLKDIMVGKAKIRGYTWHHHQDLGRMQLIPENLHSITGHIGGNSIRK